MQSKTQIDLLGERLKKGSRTEEDLTLLDAYRRTFRTPFEKMTRKIREKLKLDPSGRPAKSTSSVIDKLQRESTRLSQIQDIAGCRVVVDNTLKQVVVDLELQECFPGARRVDRLENPKYGYRAIHIIPTIDEKPIEIQVRSLLQHLWAELSEKYADKFGQDIKYGSGEDVIRTDLSELSGLIAESESLESKSFRRIIKHHAAGDKDDKVLEVEYKTLKEVSEISKKIAEMINRTSNYLDSMRLLH